MTDRPVIALLTDFGLAGAYAGVMKGVLLTALPDAQLVDLSHHISPQAIDEAAFLLETAWRFFPEGTVFLVVVDPGVGTSRRRIAIEAGGRRFVGPDNGCLSAALPDALRGAREVGEPYLARPVVLDRTVEAFQVENTALFRHPVSATFEGRDVFAPVAAYLAGGGDPAGLGRPLKEAQAFPAFRAPAPEGKARGLVIHIDSFGNVITDIRAGDLASDGAVLIGNTELPLVRTYGEAPAGQPVALIGSSGFVEIALPDGDAAGELNVAVGDGVEQL